MQNQEQHNKTCTKCKENFVYMPDEIKWFDYGTYSAKTTTCPYCGNINVIKYVNASGLYVNDDNRYYE